MACRCAFVYLALCQEELRKERREREQMEQEKDTAMNDLQHKMDNMETDYEKILHVSCNTKQFKWKLLKGFEERCEGAATNWALWVFLDIFKAPCSVNVHIYYMLGQLG